MSRETISTTVYSAAAMQLVAARHPAWYQANDAVADGMTSADLAVFASTPALETVGGLPEWGRRLPEATQIRLANLDTRPGVIKELAEPLSIAETAATSAAVNDSLRMEGFMTRFVVDGNLGLVEARRAHEVILVDIQGTKVVRDRAGLDDESCAASDAAFEAQMASRGFNLAVVRTTEHRSTPGGELIREAARHDRRNLANGALAARRPTAPTSQPTRRVATS